MAFDIYKRVAELVAENKKNMSPKELFGSETYQSFLRRKAVNIISGSFYQLRRQGFSVTEKEEKRLISSLQVVAEFNPNDNTTAYSSQIARNQFLIYINMANELVMQSESLEQMHWCIQGLLYHEVGHLLYTDFPTLRAWIHQMERGKWFPAPPEKINEVNGISLSDGLADDEYRQIVAQCGSELSNCIEDGYIEAELSAMFPGKGASALNSINDILIERTRSLEEMDEDPDAGDFVKILTQILMYSKFQEMNLGDYEGELLDPIYESVDILDEVYGKRDPIARMKATNELLCVLQPYLDKEIENKKQQDNSQPSSGSQSGSAASAISDMIQQISSSLSAGQAGQNCTHESLTNTNKAQNAGAQSRVGQGSGNGGSGKGASLGGSSADADNGANDAAAKKELKSLMNQIADANAKEQAEKERCQDMNRDATSMNCADLGIDETLNVTVSRQSSVSEQSKRDYEKEMESFAALSNKLQRDIKRILKDRREGGKRKNLYFGKRLEVMSIMHEDGKYFSRNKLPTETPRLGVGVLVDESGSTGGSLISASTCTSLIIEDFCRSLSIPHIINGYTSGGRDARIFSYAEPDEIDDGNRYRITGMSARGGTPTKAALAYILKRMKKLPVDIRLLIVITDGCSADNYPADAEGKLPIAKMIETARKDKTIIIAAGIGSDRESVKKEFGENFLDITNLEEMPEQLIGLIKANLWV